MQKPVLVVGAGFAGATVAEQLARSGVPVVLADKRDHIGGNAYDYKDDRGVHVHPYGPHIFHTNSKRIFQYLSQFTNWRFYEHRVLAVIGGETVPIPINRTTINWLNGTSYTTDAEVHEYLDNARVPYPNPKNSEEVVLNAVGHELTDLFFRGYTRKQWGRELSQLSNMVLARIPTRLNDDDRYFTDQWQFMPADGYTEMFKRMVSDPLIDIQLRTDFFGIRRGPWAHIVYTGPIDEYFDRCFGALPYRSLRFEHVTEGEPNQKAAVYNYPDIRVPYTRVTDFNVLAGKTYFSRRSVCYEYPQETGDPYYPVPTTESALLYHKYHELVKSEKSATFVGRLAQYRYYNMDQACAAGLEAAEQVLSKL